MAQRVAQLFGEGGTPRDRQRGQEMPASVHCRPSVAGRKQLYCTQPHDGGLFALAGLWEHWHDPAGEEVETCTILTTEANELMRPLHDRMPVILDPSVDALWLDPQSSADALRALFEPCASEGMEAIPVGPWVSNARNEGPRCLEPADSER